MEVPEFGDDVASIPSGTEPRWHADELPNMATPASNLGESRPEAYSTRTIGRGSHHRPVELTGNRKQGA